ncbi:MAG: J domain-containing protein [Minwuia sp.]|nr:J domain-containing protein [Minwuia sp.]
MTLATPYPLQWPTGRNRTPARRRKRAQFGQTSDARRSRGKEPVSINTARERLAAELDRLGAGYGVISSNLELRADGQPRSGQREPADPGIAVYFRMQGADHCIACDAWDRAADNIAAIAKHIEATRGMARWGCADVAAMFRGFQSLPPPDAAIVTPRHWTAVLGFPRDVTLTRDQVEARYRKLAKERHPDAGGSVDAFAELQTAIDTARKGF